MVLPRVKRLPEGFHKLPVIVTSTELERIKRSAALQPHGTYSEAIRRAMGLTPNPYRLAIRLQEQAELERTQTDNNEE
jgi:hypothetical protein